MQLSVVQVEVPPPVSPGTAIKVLLWCLCSVLLLISPGVAHADETIETLGSNEVLQFTPADLTFFETKVRPLLTENCHACHGKKTQNGGLRLDSREAILIGGESAQQSSQAMCWTAGCCRQSGTNLRKCHPVRSCRMNRSGCSKNGCGVALRGRPQAQGWQP